MEISSIKIIGSEGFQLKNRYFSMGDNYKGLAVFFPGAGYTCDMPALYYPRKVLLSQGYDVLTMEYSFQKEEKMFSKEMMKSVLVDGENTLKSALNEKPYQEFVLVGKSLGTRILSHLLTGYSQLTNSKAIYLTPVFSKDFNRLTGKVQQETLMVIGTEDPFYVPDMIEDLKKIKAFELVVLEKADHGLEVPGDCLKSIEYQKDICKAIKNFI